MVSFLKMLAISLVVWPLAILSYYVLHILNASYSGSHHNDYINSSGALRHTPIDQFQIVFHDSAYIFPSLSVIALCIGVPVALAIFALLERSVPVRVYLIICAIGYAVAIGAGWIVGLISSNASSSYTVPDSISFHIAAAVLVAIMLAVIVIWAAGRSRAPVRRAPRPKPQPEVDTRLDDIIQRQSRA